MDDQARLALLQQLNATLGPEHASTLMAALPARDWTDLATKDDLAQLEQNLEHRLTSVFHRELTVQTRIYVLAIISTVIALSSVALFTG